MPLTHWIEVVTTDPDGEQRGLLLAPAPPSGSASAAFRPTVALPLYVLLPSPSQYVAGCVSYDLCRGGMLPAVRQFFVRRCSLTKFIIHDGDPKMRGASLVTLSCLRGQHPDLIPGMRTTLP